MLWFQEPDCRNYTSETCGNRKHHQLNNFADQETTDNILSKIFNITSSSQQCSNSNVTTFFCKAAYRSCSNETDFIPMAEECIDLQEGACKDEWTQLEGVSPTLTCCNSYDPNFACPDQFARFCGMCAPVCGEFSQNGEAATIAIDVVTGISTILGNFIFGIIVFVAAFIKRKTM